MTVATVPPNDMPLFSVYLESGRCALSDALEPPSPAAGKEGCATRCVGDPSCIFFSCSQNNGTSTTPGNVVVECAIFAVCNREAAIDYTTWRIYSSTNMIGVACTAELVVNSIIVELSVHSCNTGEGGLQNVRQSPQVGSLRGVLLAAEDDGSESANCDALSISATPCQGLQYPFGAQALPFSYWRLRILWTESSRDRRPGDVDNVLLGLNLSDGSRQWPVQIVIYPAADGDPDPDTYLEMDIGSDSQPLPQQNAQRIRMQPVITVPILQGRETAAIELLAAATVCDSAIAETISLSKQSADCALAAAYMFPNYFGISNGTRFEKRITLAISTCSNPCLQTLLLAAREAASKCSAAWQGAPLSTVLSDSMYNGFPILNGSEPAFALLLTGLLSAADAVYAVDVACATNWHGSSCAAHLEDVLVGCPVLSTPGRASDIATTLMLLKGSGACQGNCSAGLTDYIYDEGCCAATIAAAENSWTEYVVRTDGLGRGFWVEWVGPRPLELFRWPDTCPTPPKSAGTATTAAVESSIMTAAVVVECQASLCNLGPFWPSACCNGSQCANGGTQVLPGPCRFFASPSNIC